MRQLTVPDNYFESNENTPDISTLLEELGELNWYLSHFQVTKLTNTERKLRHRRFKKRSIKFAKNITEYIMKFASQAEKKNIVEWQTMTEVDNATLEDVKTFLETVKSVLDKASKKYSSGMAESNEYVSSMIRRNV